MYKSGQGIQTQTHMIAMAEHDDRPRNDHDIEEREHVSITKKSPEGFELEEVFEGKFKNKMMEENGSHMFPSIFRKSLQDYMYVCMYIHTSFSYIEILI